MASLRSFLFRPDINKLREQGKVPELIQALSDRRRLNDYERVCAVAASALASVGDARAVEPLIALVSDSDWHVQKNAIFALGRLRDERAFEPVKDELMKQPQDDFAIGALIEIDPARAVQLFLSEGSHRFDLDRASHDLRSRSIQSDKALCAALATLISMDPGQRHLAIASMVSLGDRRAVGPLSALLMHGEPRAREASAIALGQLGDPRALEPLLMAFTDGEKAVRSRAAAAVNEIADSDMAHRFVEMLTDQRWEVREASAVALGYAREGDAVRALAELLNDGVPAVRQAAAEALGKIGDPLATGALRTRMGDESDEVRASAIGALGRMVDGIALEELLPALKDPSPRVRCAAAQALGETADVRATEPLIAMLEDSEPAAQRVSAQALARLADDRAVVPLVGLLSATDAEVRAAAVMALGEFPAVPITEHVLPLLSDTDRHVRLQAARSMERLCAQNERPLFASLAMLIDGDAPTRAQSAERLGQFGDSRAVVPLILGVPDPDPGVAAAVCGALGRLGDKRAVDALVTAAERDSWRVSFAAAEALGCIGDPKAVPVLTALLKEPSRLSTVAATALGRIGDTRAFVPLLSTIRRADMRSIFDREATAPLIEAAEALGKADGAAAEPILAALATDRLSFLRVEAAKILGWMRDVRAVPLLIRALYDGNEVHFGPAEEDFSTELQHEAIVALTAIGEPALDALLEELREQRDHEALARVLGSFPVPRAVDGLVILLNDDRPWVRRTALESLRQIGDPRVVPTLLAGFGRGDSDERDLLCEVLVTLARSPGDKELFKALAHLNKPSFGEEVQSLVALDDMRAVIPLVACLSWNSGSLGCAAAEVLGRLGDTRAVEPLITCLLSDSDNEIRKQAAIALGRLGDARAVEPLAAIALSDQETGLQLRARDALVSFGARAAELLIRRMKTGNDRTRFEAGIVLSEISAHNALDALLAFLAERPHDMYWIARSLGKIGDSRAVKPLMAAFQDTGGLAMADALVTLRVDGLTPAERLKIVSYLVDVAGHSHRSQAREAAEMLGKLHRQGNLDDAARRVILQSEPEIARHGDHSGWNDDSRHSDHSDSGAGVPLNWIRGGR